MRPAHAPRATPQAAAELLVELLPHRGRAGDRPGVDETGRKLRLRYPEIEHFIQLENGVTQLEACVAYVSHHAGGELREFRSVAEQMDDGEIGVGIR